MAQFDVYRVTPGVLVLQYQSDLLDDLRTRVAVPLLTVDQGPPPARRLNPPLDVGGVRYHLYPQLIATFDASEFATKVASMSSHRDEIVAAVDILLSGV